MNENVVKRRALAAIVALLLFAVVPPVLAEPLPPARAVVLVLAPGLSLKDARPIAEETNGALAVMPTRADGTDALASYRVLANGTRSPAPGGENLGRALRSGGVRSIALGGNGARVAADLSPLAAGEKEPWRVRRAEAPDGRATEPKVLAEAIRDALSVPGDRPIFIAALFDDLARADAYAPHCLPRATGEQRRDALGRLERLVAELLAIDGSVNVLLVAPEPSSAARARRERLGPALFWQAGRSDSATLLTSSSTRHTPGLVANTDVAATIATLLSISPEKRRIGAGRPMETLAVSGGEAASVYLARRVSGWAAQAREQRLLPVVPWALAVALLVMAAFRRSAVALGLWAASVPLALLFAAPLAPEAEGFAWVVYALALGLSLVPPLLAARIPARGVLAALCGATALVLALDGLLGSPLLGRSPLSYSPIEAARFYGIGNEAEGALLGASLSAAGFAGGAWSAAVVGALVVAVLGHPRLGADFGGVTASVVGFAALFLGLRGRRVSRRQIVAASALGVLLIGGLAAWEATRGARSQTHIGRAMTEARERGGGALAVIAARKAALGARLLVTSPWAVLFWAEIGVGVWLLKRERTSQTPRDAPAFRAVALCGAAALLVNDSGVVAAANCLLYGVAWAAVERLRA